MNDLEQTYHNSTTAGQDRLASTGCAPEEHRGGEPPDTRGTRHQRGATVGFVLAAPSPPSSLSPQLSLALANAVQAARTRLSAPSEGGSAPSLLDTRQQPVVDFQTRLTKGLSEAKKRAILKKEWNEQIVAALGRAVDTDELRGYELDHYVRDGRFVAKGWKDRMEGCSQQLWLSFCPVDGHTAVNVDCCGVPVCGWDQRREANKWKARASVLMTALPEGERWHKVSKRLDLDRSQFRTRPTAKMGWKMVTLGLRDTGDLALDLKRTIGVVRGDAGLRKRLSRQLYNWGAAAAYVALDVGEKNGHVHLHCLVYAPFISREAIQHWLQSQDCHKPGCKHVAGDRECEGSWDADIRRAYNPAEAMKYSVGYDNPDREDLADLHVAVYLATYGRHRVETYLLARPGAVPEVDRAEPERGVCPFCGAPMVAHATGTWNGATYTWTRAGPS